MYGVHFKICQVLSMYFLKVTSCTTVFKKLWLELVFKKLSFLFPFSFLFFFLFLFFSFSFSFNTIYKTIYFLFKNLTFLISFTFWVATFFCDDHELVQSIYLKLIKIYFFLTVGVYIIHSKYNLIIFSKAFCI